MVIPILLSSLAAFSAQAETCLSEKSVVALDAQYEKALQVGDVKFLEKLLAPEFYWVHNLASMKEKKSELLARVQKPEEQAKERRSHDTTQQRLGNTVVVQGLSSVDKLNADGKTFRTSRYQFMRTYVEDKGECKLLAVQTMKVWSSDGN
ncbi:MAG: nuclear transport factor 2 family protein [Cellvibrio sp.]|uniref:nuclear transport factor 2 family protein n=1 Tax=Cellvibrio sp. TaxID=1965322 RepID=UPI0031B3006D